MMLNTIRKRMLAAALAPVLLVVVLLVGVFFMGRVDDLGTAHQARGRLLVRQVAMASEYGLFSGSTAVLQSAASTVQRETDIRWVGIFDRDGHLAASAGVQPTASFNALIQPEYAQGLQAQGLDALVEPVTLAKTPLDDMFALQGDTSTMPLVLGYAVMVMSRDSLAQRERELAWVTLLVAMFGISLGGLLAVRLGERVVQPILDVSRRIGRIGQGDFSAPQWLPRDDPLHELQEGLSQMASRLAWGRDELEQRVSDTTAQLRLKKEEAENATLAKSQFMAAASHDLRQPTHALGLFVSRLGQLPLDEKARQLVGGIHASVQAMQDLLDGLLDLSRLESGSVQVQSRSVSINSIFDALRPALTSLAREKGLRLRVCTTNVWGHSDAVLLQRMVMNLAHNAIRYTEQGTVLLCCRRVNAGSAARIDVMDSGVGISEEHQEKIFQEFYQVGNSGRDRAMGLGLGLNIVERSAKLLGHTVVVRSHVGCGTRFSITLPLVDALNSVDEAAPPVAAADYFVESAQKLKILVLEDDDSARDAVCELLESWGYRVWAAQTPEQAHGYLGQGVVPDAIVSDYRLGHGVNGIEAIVGLRQATLRQIPACLMSGNTDGALMQAAHDAGLTLLHKPVRPAKLRSLLRHLVAQVL